MGSLAIQTEDRLKQLHFTKDRISLDRMDGPTITRKIGFKAPSL
jgi:hypothetical protein